MLWLKLIHVSKIGSLIFWLTFFCPCDTYEQQVTGSSTLYIKAVCLFGLKPLYNQYSIGYKTSLSLTCNKKSVKIQAFPFKKMLLKLFSAESLPYQYRVYKLIFIHNRYLKLISMVVTHMSEWNDTTITTIMCKDVFVNCIYEPVWCSTLATASVAIFVSCVYGVKINVQ